MRIAVFTHYFPPEIGAPQARISETARSWAKAGDDVVVVTGMPNHPTGVVPPEYRGRWKADEVIDGYRVARCWLYATRNEGIAKRTLGHISFAVTSFVSGARRAGRPDVVMVTSPTFFSIFPAWLFARLRRAKFVVEIRDLWPAIFVELGVLKNKTVIGVLEWLELAAYRGADAVVVVTDGFRDNLVERGVPADKVHVIRNGADMGRFDATRDLSVREQLGVTDDRPLVLYIGAHGVSHGLESIAEAAALLRDERIHFAFVGEGAAKAALASRVQSLGLTNVTMLGGVAPNVVPTMLAAADICLAPLRDVPLFASFIPSKIFEYLAAERAVIGSVRGEPAEILRHAGAVVVEPEDSASLADAIRALANDPERRTAMGREGRIYVAANHDRSVLAERYRVMLSGLVGASPTGSGRE
jgi:glycosyltransferase involved in cell wall biosynthesis